MNIPPLTENLKVFDKAKRQVIGETESWTQSWAQFFTNVFRAVKGWNESLTATVTFDFGAIAAGSQATTTVTVSGARSGDAVIVQAATATNGIDMDGSVTADDTVTIRAKNYSTGSVNPASMSYRVIVLRN